MDINIDVKLTAEWLQESRTLITAASDADRDALSLQLLRSRIGGERDQAEVVEYLANTLFATVTYAASLVGIVADHRECDSSAVIRALAAVDDWPGLQKP